MKTGRLVWQLLVRPNLEHAALWWIEGTLQTQIKLHGDCSGRGYGLTKVYLGDSGNSGFMQCARLVEEVEGKSCFQ